jgi:putative ABC transport system permease protein
MGIPILSGRAFKPEEVGDFDNERCIVSRTFANAYLGGQDPIGREILTGVTLKTPEPCRIVGVVADTHLTALDAPPEPLLYFAAYVMTDNLVVRTATDPLAVAQAVQREVVGVDPEQPLSSIRTMGDVLSKSLSRRNLLVVLLVLFSGVGLVLASLGIYGVVSYSVTLRTQEIGVRMALGSRTGGVFWLILSQGLSVTGIGLAFGVVAAAGATRLMSSLLFGIGSGDLLSFGVGCLLILAVSALACFIPAYRATRVDPLVALRYE